MKCDGLSIRFQSLRLIPMPGRLSFGWALNLCMKYDNLSIRFPEPYWQAEVDEQTQQVAEE